MKALAHNLHVFIVAKVFFLISPSFMKMGQYRKMQICTFLLSVRIRLLKIGVGNEGGLRGHRQDLKPRSEFVRVRLSQQSVPLLCFYLVLSCQCVARASVLSKRIFVSVRVKETSEIRARVAAVMLT